MARERRPIRHRDFGDAARQEVVQGSCGTSSAPESRGERFYRVSDCQDAHLCFGTRPGASRQRNRESHRPTRGPGGVSFLQLGPGNCSERAVPNAERKSSCTMIVTGKHLSRRSFLRSTGALIGLPLLDAMVPALAWARPANRHPPLRMGFVYVPNGMVMSNWTPATQGTRFAFPPILKPLEPFREHSLILSGLMDHNANALGDGGGDHARAAASFLTGAHPRETGSDIHAGVSADQVAAQAIGRQTRLASLELGHEDHRIVG